MPCRGRIANDLTRSGPAKVIKVDVGDDQYVQYNSNEIWVDSDPATEALEEIKKMREELKVKRTREGSTSKPKKFKPAWWKTKK